MGIGREARRSARRRFLRLREGTAQPFSEAIRAGESEGRKRPDLCRLPGIRGAWLLQPRDGSGGACLYAYQQRLAKHAVPASLLARLAVDRTCQGRGLGKALVEDAPLRTAPAADIVGGAPRPCQERRGAGMIRSLGIRAESHGSPSPVFAHEGLAEDIERMNGEPPLLGPTPLESFGATKPLRKRHVVGESLACDPGYVGNSSDQMLDGAALTGDEKTRQPGRGAWMLIRKSSVTADFRAARAIAARGKLYRNGQRLEGRIAVHEMDALESDP